MAIYFSPERGIYDEFSDEIRITVFAELDKEYMYYVGVENGLSRVASDYLKWFNEVPLLLTVDKQTGEVKNWERGSR